MPDVNGLPPTQYLIMETLAARARLGESIWPFPTRLAPAVRALEDRGLAAGIHGNVPGFIRARLTDAGREATLSATYRPPQQPVTEHAREMTGGWNLRRDEPLTESVYPLAQWIRHGQENGGKVYRRRIIVVDDWEEVPGA